MSGHTLTTKNVFDDLLDIIPIVKDCNADKTKCLCTDPSYLYKNKCSIKPINTDHTGRSQCSYGKTGDNQAENSVSGNLKNSDKYNYTVGTTTGRASFSKDTSGLGSQPPSLLFCANPTGTGALPTKTKSQITPGTDGSIDSGEWKTSSVGNDTTQTNLGFDT